jgi:hypothetical protein
MVVGRVRGARGRCGATSRGSGGPPAARARQRDRHATSAAPRRSVPFSFRGRRHLHLAVISRRIIVRRRHSGSLLFTGDPHSVTHPAAQRRRERSSALVRATATAAGMAHERTLTRRSRQASDGRGRAAMQYQHSRLGLRSASMLQCSASRLTGEARLRAPAQAVTTPFDEWCSMAFRLARASGIDERLDVLEPRAVLCRREH